MFAMRVDLKKFNSDEAFFIKLDKFTTKHPKDFEKVITFAKKLFKDVQKNDENQKNNEKLIFLEKGYAKWLKTKIYPLEILNPGDFQKWWVLLVKHELTLIKVSKSYKNYFSQYTYEELQNIKEEDLKKIQTRFKEHFGDNYYVEPLVIEIMKQHHKFSKEQQIMIASYIYTLPKDWSDEVIKVITNRDDVETILINFLNHELSMEFNPATALRSTTPFSMCASPYIAKIGYDWLTAVVFTALTKIEHQRNQNNYLDTVEEILMKIKLSLTDKESLGKIPNELITILSIIDQKVNSKESPNDYHLSLSFLFLRIINPCILVPQNWGFVSVSLNSQVARTTVAKEIQLLANNLNTNFLEDLRKEELKNKEDEKGNTNNYGKLTKEKGSQSTPILPITRPEEDEQKLLKRTISNLSMKKHATSILIQTDRNLDEGKGTFHNVHMKEKKTQSMHVFQPTPMSSTEDIAKFKSLLFEINKAFQKKYQERQ